MFSKVVKAFAVFTVVCRFCSVPAEAQLGVALVIGNSSYKFTPALANPRNDATDVSAVLKASGWIVLEALDLTKVDMDRKIAEFGTKLSGAAAGLLFYAGHGLQVGGHNYLVPIDAKLTTAAALDFEMVRLDLIQRTMERETKTNILFLDACRDNPLARNLARAMGTRSTDVGRGLAVTESGVGTLISFSTQPGNVAVDGVGRNSPFAGALVTRLRSSGTHDLSSLLIDVRNDVIEATQNKQVPWEHSALRSRFFFGTPAASAKTASRGDSIPKSQEQRLYDGLMRRILSTKLAGSIDSKDKGKDNYYRSGGRPPKSLAACINWEKSTPFQLVHTTFSFAIGDKTQSDADERALSQCYIENRQTCSCTLVDRNDASALEFPPVWVERHRSVLQKQ